VCRRIFFISVAGKSGYSVIKASSVSKILIDQNALLLVIDMHSKSTSCCKLAFEVLGQSKK